MNQIIERVWEYSKKNPQGFTLNIITMRPIEYGICVAYKETQNSFGKESLNKVVKHAMENEKIVGGWLNDDNDKYYFDSVRIFKNSQLEEAIRFGKENEQLEIFDLTNLKSITII